MQFRPCIDIHNGKVKQIVGGTLKDSGDFAKENFVSDMNADDFAKMYKSYGLKGGHIILLNAKDSEFYRADVEQAKLALSFWPDSLQIGGGITDENARYFIDIGASHVIVTSFVFVDGQVRFDRLKALKSAVGAEHIVLDMSCRKKDGRYLVVTDRWQKYTSQIVNEELFDSLSEYCDEFLVHAVNVEGTGLGLDTELISILSKHSKRPITYAGGISSMKDIETLDKLGNGKINFTIGSALDIFGGKLRFTDVVNCSN